MSELPSTVIVGAGRFGQALAGLLVAHGVPVRFATRRPGRDLPAPAGLIEVAETFTDARWIILAVPDDAIWELAGRIGGLGVVGKRSVVLHLSGALDRHALKPLRLTGAALGSFHPLQSVAVPITAPERLRGAYVGIEGDPIAVRASKRLAKCLGMIPVMIPEGAKPAYHAAATLVSTYVVTLYDAAIQLAIDAGIDTPTARSMFLPLIEGTVANLELLPAHVALTGAVRRGDVATIKAHLGALDPDDRRLYLELGRRALALARKMPLDPDRLAAMEKLFRNGK